MERMNWTIRISHDKMEIIRNRWEHNNSPNEIDGFSKTTTLWNEQIRFSKLRLKAFASCARQCLVLSVRPGRLRFRSCCLLLARRPWLKQKFWASREAGTSRQCFLRNTAQKNKWRRVSTTSCELVRNSWRTVGRSCDHWGIFTTLHLERYSIDLYAILITFSTTFGEFVGARWKQHFFATVLSNHACQGSRASVFQ